MAAFALRAGTKESRNSEASSQRSRPSHQFVENNRATQHRRPSISLPLNFTFQNGDKEDKKEISMFVDAEEVKKTVRNNLLKDAYDVTKLYHEQSLWATIATHPLFDKLTLLVIGINSIWIGVDTDHNSAEILLNADPIFQIVEHFFCVYFAFEWVVRFMSFKSKADGLRDAWFLFDSMLVSLMVMEAWLFSAIMLLSEAGSGSTLNNTSVLRVARLARLTRMARMARLLRAMPELMILIKGLAGAARSVLVTLMLLTFLLYLFAIVFTQLSHDTPVGDDLFRDVPSSMYTLLVYGTLMDNIGHPLEVLIAENGTLALVYLLFVFLASITFMNMLIGVLCEVVTTVASIERETLAVNFVKNRLECVIREIDEDGSGSISKDEFLKILDCKEALKALTAVGVDVEGIAEQADFIFADEEDNEQERERTLGEFLSIVLQFRGTNLATVKDIIDLHKFLKKKVDQSVEDMKEAREILVPWLDFVLKLASSKQRLSQTEQKEEDVLQGLIDRYAPEEAPSFSGALAAASAPASLGAKCPDDVESASPLAHAGDPPWIAPPPPMPKFLQGTGDQRTRGQVPPELS